ncbi:uncharacterized mitochondrial protein-like protein [Tanacetum coccineum]
MTGLTSELLTRSMIIREKRIAAYKGYRGGGVVQVKCGSYGVSCGGLNRLKVWRLLYGAAAVVAKRREMWTEFGPRNGVAKREVHSRMVLQKIDEDPIKDSECNDQGKEDNVNSPNNVNAASTNKVNTVGGKISIELLVDPNMPALEDYSIFDFSKNDEDDGLLKRKIDKTLFIKRHKGDILLVQVYVDDIIFGSTKKELCFAFKKLMHEKFQMSSMGELTFFLGLQVKQKKDGIFISQDKYVDEILKKFGFTEVKTASTPIETQKPLLKDEDGEEVDVHMYRSMIGSLMYLTSSRPDIMFAVCACARYQVNPKVSHLHAVKRIFRYLKGQPKLGLWYPKDSPFDLVAYTDSDYAGASLDRKSTTGGCQFLGCRLISWQCKKQTVVANSTTKAEYVAASSCCGQVLWIQNQLLDYGYNFMHTKIFIDNNSSAIPTDPHHTPTIIQSSTQPQKTQQPRKPKRKDTQVPQPSDPIENVADEAVHKELGDSLVRAATTASSLEAEQDSGNINKTQSKATPNESSSLGTTSGGGPKCQETIGDTIAQTRFESVSKHSNDSLLARDEEITLVSVQNVDEEMFDINVSAGEEVVKEVVEVINTAKLIIDAAQVNAAGDIVSIASAATTTTAIITTVDDITLAQALMEIKSTKPKEKRVVI